MPISRSNAVAWARAEQHVAFVCRALENMIRERFDSIDGNGIGETQQADSFNVTERVADADRFESWPAGRTSIQSLTIQAVRHPLDSLCARPVRENEHEYEFVLVFVLALARHPFSSLYRRFGLPCTSANVSGKHSIVP